MTMVKSGVRIAELEEGKPRGIELNGVRMALFIKDGKVYVINSVCKHKGGPLEEGKLEGYEIVCPWHAARYDIRSGKGSKDTPWGADTETYKAEAGSDGEVLIEV